MKSNQGGRDAFNAGRFGTNSFHHHALLPLMDIRVRLLHRQSGWGFCV
jgi:hypothetical protein